jgi:hypothetical protein
VLRSFAADLAMMVASSGVGGWSREQIDWLVADLVSYADGKYLSAIDVTLLYGSVEVRAARYAVSESAETWGGDRPGNSLWPRTPGGHIQISTLWTVRWLGLSSGDKATFRASLNFGWTDSELDLSHRGLVQRQDRRFASNGFGLEKATYGT